MNTVIDCISLWISHKLVRNIQRKSAAFQAAVGLVLTDLVVVIVLKLNDMTQTWADKERQPDQFKTTLFVVSYWTTLQSRLYVQTAEIDRSISIRSNTRSFRLYQSMQKIVAIK